VGWRPQPNFLTTENTKKTEKLRGAVALPDEIACENCAMGLSIVKKDGASVGRARRSRPMLAVRFHDRKTAGAYGVRPLADALKTGASSRTPKSHFPPKKFCVNNKKSADSSTNFLKS